MPVLGRRIGRARAPCRGRRLTPALPSAWRVSLDLVEQRRDPLEGAARSLAAGLDRDAAARSGAPRPRYFERRTAATTTALRNPTTSSAALIAPHQSWPDCLGDRPGRERPDERERLHEAPEHREDLPPAVVRDGLLDQRHVADEADAVPDPEDDRADAADREVRG